MRDALPVRIGGIAANLSHLKNAARQEELYTLAHRLIEETRWFIEWSGPEAEIEITAYLVEIQRELTAWKSCLATIWQNPEEREHLARQSETWSQKVLELSGLLGEEYPINEQFI